jgi:general secretion pathway protein I
MNRGPKLKTEYGFTLIEIIIALAIVAVGVLAVVHSMNQNAQNVSEIEKRMLASWVAGNQIAELRLSAQLQTVKIGKRSNTVDMGGVRWNAKVDVSNTDVNKVFRLTVSVFEVGSRNQQALVTMNTAIRAND